MAHFRIFGSSFYFHVTKDAWKKLEPKAELGIFVGYFDTPRNYWVYLPTNRMPLVCRDVNLDEENAMRCSLERELHLHVVKELLAPKKESQFDVENPHAEDLGVETSTQGVFQRWEKVHQ